MKKLIRFALLYLAFVLTGTAFGQSNLPACQGSDKAKWKNCFGTYTTPKGTKYVGSFKDGKEHGKGTDAYANGDKYVGEFKDGINHGQGTYTFADGDKYVGEFKDNAKHGRGIETYADGSPAKEGIWADHKFVRAEKIDIKTQTVTSDTWHVAAKSLKEACYPSGDYTISYYSDGRKARNVDVMRSGEKMCDCWISDASGDKTYEIYLSLRTNDPLAIRKPDPVNLWNIYTKQKYPFGGCPSEYDYQQIVQSINNDKKQKEVQEAEKQKNLPKLTKEETAAIKQLCQVIVDQNSSVEDACATAGDIDRCIKIKRNKILTDLKVNNWERKIGILTICGSLGFPLNVLSWGMD